MWSVPEKVLLSCLYQGVEPVSHRIFSDALQWKGVSSAQTPRRKCFFLTGRSSNTPPIATAKRTPITAGKTKAAGIRRSQVDDIHRCGLGPIFSKEAAGFWQVLQRNKYFFRNQLMKTECLTRTALMRFLKQEKKTPMQETCWAQKDNPHWKRIFIEKIEIIIYWKWSLPLWRPIMTYSGETGICRSFITASVSSVTQLWPTLCNLMDCRTPGFPVHHQLPELVQIHVHWVCDAIQPSHPLLSPSTPAFNLS